MKRLKRHIYIGLLCGFVTFLLSLTPFFELAELKGYDLFHFFKREAGRNQIVVVGIDEPSFAEIGRQWPWPRSLHARLINTLKKEGAAVIGLDIIFSEPSSPAEDSALSGAIEKAGNVVLASDTAMMSDSKYLERISVQPLALFSKGSETGLAAVPLDRDGVVRRFYSPPVGEALFSRRIADLYTKKTHRIPSGCLISYAGPPGTFDTISYYQALDPAAYLPKDFFKGKIVLVGRTVKANPDPDKTPADYFETPFFFSGNSGLMSGVEIHANMTDDIINDRFGARSGPILRLLIFLSAGIAGSLLQINWKPFAGALKAVASLTAYLIFSYVIFATHRLWMPTFGMVVPFMAPYASSGIGAYLQSEKKRREIKRAFSHYLSPSILEAVLAKPEMLKLGGERVEATILFSDIAGFTSISENMKPEEVAEFLNIYLDGMTREIIAHGGTVDKFVGDAVMAFWGAPLADPDHALNACRAALAMQEAAAGLREKFARDGLPELHMRVGINTGNVIVGNMGSSNLFDYTVLGDPVNLASRLEGVNKEFGTSIIISMSVHEKTLDSVKVRPLGAVRVKGKAEDIEIYELLGVNANRDTARRHDEQE